MMKVRTALISVSDKTGLEPFATGLHALGIRILSTGGTARTLLSYGVPVTEVSDYIGFPEILDGRVKTLHPKIHAGLLARRDKSEHLDQLRQQGIEPIDMVVVNLYPFEEVVQKDGVSLEEAIENIDIGGPSMLRSAAKNAASVAVVCDPVRYPGILQELRDNAGALQPQTLAALAVEVFRRTAYYDAKIAEFLGRHLSPEKQGLPDFLTVALRKKLPLRYGENPHQQGAFYVGTGGGNLSVANAVQLHGKELSFNNILDLDAAVSLVAEFAPPAAVVVKHNNPCGVACAHTPKQAFLDALACDRLSAFGGIIGLNREVNGETAEAIVQAGFTECVIAPGFTEGARGILTQKKNIRLMVLTPWQTGGAPDRDLKKVEGGVLVQDADTACVCGADLRVVTKQAPTEAQRASLLFGWTVVKHVRSNAIVICQAERTIGIGAGQMSRVDSVRLAIEKAQVPTTGAVLASDAFFPKPDSIDLAHQAGIAAIIQPGGSIADDEVIRACDRYGIAMIFTGKRHFRH